MNLRTVATFAVLSWGSHAHALDLVGLRQAEKVALTLTGHPLPDDMRKDLIDGKIKIENIVDVLSKDPRFIEYYAQYWARTMGFQQPSKALDLIPKGTDKSLLQVADKSENYVFKANDAKVYTAEYMEKRIWERYKGPYQIFSRDICDDGPMIYSVFGSNVNVVKKAAEEGIGPDGNPILPGTLEYWKKLLPIWSQSSLKCDDSTLVKVTAWWDPAADVSSKYPKGTQYLVPPVILEHCGASLRNCSLATQPQRDPFMDAVNMDMMLEPSYIIAHAVAEDRPFTEILTGTDTIMTGAYAAFMHNQGDALWDNFPGGEFPGIANLSIFKTPSVTDRKHYRVKRGALHAGVLTTPAFQVLTNGRRAKANRAYETFFCNKFQVPSGLQPDPNDDREDLTKRTYCQACHITIEPMAAFFGHWPDTGGNNFIYDDKNGFDDTGSFLGNSGKGAAAFAKIMAKNDQFGVCAVQRAFEFVNGRGMSDDEKAKVMPKYLSQLKTGDMKLRAVIKAMLLTPEFLTPGGK